MAAPSAPVDRRQILRRAGLRSGPWPGSAIPNFGESSPGTRRRGAESRPFRRHDPNCALSSRRSAGNASSADRPAPARNPRLLRRLPAQPLDPRAGRKPGARRHWLPYDGDAGEPHADDDRLAHGRRGGDVARPAAVHPPERMCSPISATAPMPIPACWRCVRRSPPNVPMTYKVLFDRLRLDDRRPADRRRHDADPDPGRARRRGRQENGARRRRPGPLPRRCPATSGSPCITATRWTRFEAGFREFKGVSVHPLRPALRHGTPAVCASAANGPTPPSAPSFIRRSAKAAATAGASPTAWRSSRSRPSSAASGGSTSRAATRISPASTASVRASSPCTAGGFRGGRRVAARPLSAACAGADAARNRRALQRAGAGIGGSGVVTVSQTLAVAAYLDGLFSSNLDLTGLSQKYGAVTSHVRIARNADALHATRIASGEADALIGCDLIVAAGDECASKLNPQTRAVISADLTPTADFARNPNWSVDAEALIERLKSALGDKLLSSTRSASPRTLPATRSPRTCSCSARPRRGASCR